MEHEPLTGAETLMGFLAWVTSRAESVTFGCCHDAAPAIALYDAYALANPGMGEIRQERWPACVTSPTENLYPVQGQPSSLSGLSAWRARGGF